MEKKGFCTLTRTGVPCSKKELQTVTPAAAQMNSLKTDPPHTHTPHSPHPSHTPQAQPLTPGCIQSIAFTLPLELGKDT